MVEKAIRRETADRIRLLGSDGNAQQRRPITHWKAAAVA